MTASPDVVAAALKQVEQGFAVFALGIDVKTPVTEHGFKNATTKPDWVRTQLGQKSAGNYGMVWPTDAGHPILILDLDDGDGATTRWQDRLLTLIERIGPLPATKSTRTPSGGRHAFYTWPATVPIPPGDSLFGFTVRWPGRGYVVGPGSSIDGKSYVAGPERDIAALPEAWSQAALAEHRPRSQKGGNLIVVKGGFELPDAIPAGRRYATVRDYVASRYNSGLASEELWSLVQSEVAPRFVEPKSEMDLRADFERTMAKIKVRLGAPRKTTTPEDAVAAVSPIPVVNLGDVAVEAVTWLWHRYLPIGSITLFDGNPGEGKSTAVADIIARLTRGSTWPDDADVGAPGDVLYVTKEDDPATQVRPRIEAAGGDVKRVSFVATDLLFPRDLPRFRDLLEETRPRLVLLDPLMSYLEGKVRAISDNEVRSALMTPLAEIAREVGCALLVIRHFNKGTGQSALNRGAGSLGGLAGAARMVLAMAPDPEDDDERTRVFGVVKSNYEARPPSLKVVIDSAPVEGFHMTVSLARWLGTSSTSVGDLMERTREQHQLVLDAEDVLQEVLTQASEPMPSRAVFDAMKARGHSRSAVYGAARALRVHSERAGFPGKTTWSLPVVTDVTLVSDGKTTGATGQNGQSSDPSLSPESVRLSPLSSRPSSSSHDSGGGYRARARPHARDGPAEGPTRVIASTDQTITCRDYRGHQGEAHIGSAKGWICTICSPDGAGP